MVIYLGWQSPATSSGLPAVQAVRAGPHRLFGLAPTGGYRAAAVTSRAVGSYPTISPLPVSGRFVFCGPVRRLAAPRRYLAVCPAELGLSSIRKRGPRPSRPTNLLSDRKIASTWPTLQAGAVAGRANPRPMFTNPPRPLTGC